MASFKCSLGSPQGKAVLQTRGSSFLIHATSGPHASPPSQRHSGRYEVQATTSIQPQPRCIPAQEISIFETEGIFNIFHSVNIFISISHLLPPAPRPLVGAGKQNGCCFSRLNKNKSGSRRRPADRDVLGGFATRQQRPSARSTGNTLQNPWGEAVKGGHAPGPCDWLPGRGTGNGCGIPGLRRASTAVWGPCTAPWCFPPGIPLTCLSVPSAPA